jgi:CRISPR/Cas system CMR subunit Cmr4 (Cas7 group RAMP superfamily)
MHTHRYIARFILEAETPLFVGSGQSSLLKDALVQKDCNGFPMINGTSLAGVLRHSFASDNWTNDLFGYSDGNEGSGSLLKVSSAYMMLGETQVSEGILEKPNAGLLNRFNDLPVRRHVRITDKGVAADKGLFDNEIVYKGTRFIFELELKGTPDDTKHWDSIINQVRGLNFRIGSGTRNGYGSLKVVYYYNKSFNLTIKKEFDAYLNFSPSLNTKLEWKKPEIVKADNAAITTYSLKLKPDSFFIFSEGFGDDEADNRPLEEEIITYKNDVVIFEKQTVIPASSIKGAIAHRLAYHYNRMTGQFADNDAGKTGIENEAVAALFGKAGQDSSGKVIESQAGVVYLNDFYFSDKEVRNDKIFNHLAIDRFTGGGMDGALFSEKVSDLQGNDFNFSVAVKYTDNGLILESLESALSDICKGLLPLGGMTTKGHGVFTGSLYKNGIEIFNYNTQN